MRLTIDTPGWLREHGDQPCAFCIDGYPVRCRCGGYIHCEVDQDETDLIYSCDICGLAYEYKDYEPEYEEEDSSSL